MISKLNFTLAAMFLTLTCPCMGYMLTTQADEAPLTLCIEVQRPPKTPKNKTIKPPHVDLSYRKGAKPFASIKPGGYVYHPGGIWARAYNGARFTVTRLGNPQLYYGSDTYFLAPLPSRSSLDFPGDHPEVGLGGRPKGVSDVYSPVAGGLMWPERFLLRWKPYTDGETISMKIVEERSNLVRTLWSVKGIDGKSGSLQAPVARQALDKWRIGKISPAPLKLLFQVDGQSSAILVKFFVLSKQKEAQLRDHLQWWQTHTIGTTRLTGQANELLGLGLIYDAAVRYQAASDLYPHSPLLRQRAEDTWTLAGR